MELESEPDGLSVFIGVNSGQSVVYRIGSERKGGDGKKDRRTRLE